MAHRNIKKTWQQLSRTRDFECAHFVVEKDEVVLPSGEVGDYFVIDPGQSVFVIPQVSETEFVMIEQFRYPLQRMSFEFPAGGIEEGESGESAAARELKEETGMTADVLTRIGGFAVEPSRSVQMSTVYLATGLTFGQAKNDPDEQIEVLGVTHAEIDQMIADGIIIDGPTLAAWTLFQQYTKRV